MMVVFKMATDLANTMCLYAGNHDSARKGRKWVVCTQYTDIFSTPMLYYCLYLHIAPAPPIKERTMLH